MKRKTDFIKNKLIMESIIVCTLLISVSTSVAVVNGQQTLELIEKEDSIVESYTFLSNIFDERKDSERASFEDLYDEIKEYAFQRNIHFSEKTFFPYFEKMIKNLEQDQMNFFIQILYSSFKHANEMEISLSELYFVLNNHLDLIHDETKRVYLEVDEFLDSKQIKPEFSPQSKKLMEQFHYPKESIESNSDDGTPEEYWKEFGRAKGYWFGFYPRSGDEPSQNIRDIYWYADNFYDWFNEAADYLFGNRGFQWKDFEGYNAIGLLLFSLSFVLTVLSFILGVVTADSFFFALGVVPGIFSPLVGILLLAYNYKALTYFLYGTNSFLRLLSVDFVELIDNDPDDWNSGETNIVLRITDEDNNGIDGCTVYANNTDCMQKISESQGNPEEWGSWVNDKDLFGADVVVNEEFQYQLKQGPSNEIKGQYSLFDRDIPKYEKAVPPPGEYEIYIANPPDGFVGGEVPKEKIAEAKTGECVFVEVTLSKDNGPS